MIDMSNSLPALPDKKIALSVRNLAKEFPVMGGTIIRREVAQLKAVDGISFDLDRGQTLGLVGESGCGKSTLGRCLLRLIEPTAGHVQVNGVDVISLNPAKMRQMRRHLQMVFPGSLWVAAPAHDYRGQHCRAVAHNINDAF